MLEKFPYFNLPHGSGISREYLNLLKWFALVAMTAFHFSYALMLKQLELFVLIGRLAFPIFGFILGYNLAAAVAKNDVNIEKRLMRALLMFGCFAQPFYWGFVHKPLPLNIMFSLALGVFIVFRYRSISAWMVLVLFGFVVDYAWAGPLFVLASYFVSSDLLKNRIGLLTAISFITAIALVATIVGSIYPLLVLLLLLVGLYWHPQFQLPRCKWLFYVFYPAHLAILQWLNYFYIS